MICSFVWNVHGNGIWWETMSLNAWLLINLKTMNSLNSRYAACSWVIFSPLIFIYTLYVIDHRSYLNWVFVWVVSNAVIQIMRVRLACTTEKHPMLICWLSMKMNGCFYSFSPYTYVDLGCFFFEFIISLSAPWEVVERWYIYFWIRNVCRLYVWVPNAIS